MEEEEFGPWSCQEAKNVKHLEEVLSFIYSSLTKNKNSKAEPERVRSIEFVHTAYSLS